MRSAGVLNVNHPPKKILPGEQSNTHEVLRAGKREHRKEAALFKSIHNIAAQHTQ
jgi:hypothetical protein